MANLFNDSRTPIPVRCQHCGQEFTKPLGELKLVADLTCPSCRQGFRVDAKHLNAAVQKGDKLVADFVRGLGSLGKRR